MWIINLAVGCHYFPPRPAVTPATLKWAATSFAAWWTEAQWVWTVCRRLLPDSITTAPDSSMLTSYRATLIMALQLFQHSLVVSSITGMGTVHSKQSSPCDISKLHKIFYINITCQSASERSCSLLCITARDCTQMSLLTWVVVLHPTGHQIGDFGDVFPSQSRGFVRKKLNPTQQKHTFTNQKKRIITKINTKPQGQV